MSRIRIVNRADFKGLTKAAYYDPSGIKVVLASLEQYHYSFVVAQILSIDETHLKVIIIGKRMPADFTQDASDGVYAEHIYIPNIFKKNNSWSQGKLSGKIDVRSLNKLELSIPIANRIDWNLELLMGATFTDVDYFINLNRIGDATEPQVGDYITINLGSKFNKFKHVWWIEDYQVEES